MTNVPVVARLDDCPDDGRIVQFLGVIDVIASRVSCSMDVADPADVLLDGADHVALHDLHVVDVEQYLDAGAVDALADSHRPGRVIARAPGMVYLGVQQLQVQVDALLLSIRRDPPKAVGNGLDRLKLALVR